MSDIASQLQKIRDKINTDRFAKFMGIRLEELREGYCKMTMTVTGDMINFHDLAHGGAIFALADAAFAGASNSHGHTALGLSMNINYRSPANLGMRLTAEAFEESRGRTTALYRVVVKCTEQIVAIAQGMVYIKTKS